MPASAHQALPERDSDRTAGVLEDVAFVVILVSAVALVAGIAVLLLVL